MKPIAVALDILQGETTAYMGILLPVITITLDKLTSIIDGDGVDKKLKYCEPLVNTLIAGVRERFASQLNDIDNMLASAFHPQFKLSWLNDGEKTERVKDRMVRLINEKEKYHDEHSSSEDTGENDFFAGLRKRSTSRENAGKKQVNAYLEMPITKELPTPQTFPSRAFLELFIKYNTGIPSSAAVERMFSIGKDILKPKRARLSDDHFEMLVFLKDSD